MQRFSAPWPHRRSRGRWPGRCLRIQPGSWRAQVGVRGDSGTVRAGRTWSAITLKLAPSIRPEADPTTGWKGVRWRRLIALLQAPLHHPRRNPRIASNRLLGRLAPWPHSPSTLHLQLGSCGREAAAAAPRCCPPSRAGNTCRPNRALHPLHAPSASIQAAPVGDFLGGLKQQPHRALSSPAKGSTKNKTHTHTSHAWCVGHGPQACIRPCWQEAKGQTVRSSTGRASNTRKATSAPPRGPSSGPPRRSGPHPHAPSSPSCRNSPPPRAAV